MVKANDRYVEVHCTIPSLRLCLSLSICLYLYICMCVCIYEILCNKKERRNVI